MKHDRVRLEFQDKVAILTLNDPSVLNALGYYLKQDLTEALDVVDTSGARCLLIAGAGRAFCSGANLNDPNRPPRDREAELRGEVKSDLEAWYNPTLIRIRNMDIPIVTAINGIAAGAGMSLALCGDIKIAAKSASFLQAFARILPRLIGVARAMELSLLAERLPAETALQWGLINRLVEDVELMPKSLEMATSLANGPRSLGMIRRMYWASLDNTLEQQLDLEAQEQKHAGMTEDHAEGIAAFREKRHARFSGR
jgi:2-(1,2-epoxy-1,2-dihydrophenyl)acetyl-CoA isomerase